MARISAVGPSPSSRKTRPIDSRFTPFHVEIRRSPIHGLGVFAAVAIPKGRKVVEYTGERVSRLEGRRRFVRAWLSREKRLYLARLDPYWSIDGAYGGSGAELVNHSCEPNLCWKKDRGRLFLRSRRKIRRGEELTIDYAFRKDGPRIACHCGAPACRGTVNQK